MDTVSGGKWGRVPGGRVRGARGLRQVDVITTNGQHKDLEESWGRRANREQTRPCDLVSERVPPFTGKSGRKHLFTENQIITRGLAGHGHYQMFDLHVASVAERSLVLYQGGNEADEFSLFHIAHGHNV